MSVWVHVAFLFYRALKGKMLQQRSNNRTALDQVEGIKYLLTECYPDRTKILLVLDNPNIHVVGSYIRDILCREHAAMRSDWKFVPVPSDNPKRQKSGAMTPISGLICCNTLKSINGKCLCAAIFPALFFLLQYIYG